MKNWRTVALVAFAFLVLASCKQGVTLTKLQKQEAEAREELQEVQEELITLANMKEEYAVQSKQTQLRKMRNRLAEVDEELNNLNKVKSSDNNAVQGSVKQAITALEKEEEKLRQSIAELEALPKENWAASIETINEKIAHLAAEVNKIMANVKSD